MLFDFLLNAQIMLALARQNPEPVIDALRDTPALSLTSPIAAKDRRPGQRPERPVQQRLSVWTA
jgi:hypothetical protein